MELNKFVLGQKVRVIKDETKPELKGKVGYIIEEKAFGYGVEFDEYINGHNCSLTGTNGCCWYIAKGNLEAVKEYQEQTGLFKFKDIEALKKAYLELEKEFSRKSQAYKELAEEHDQFVEAYNEKIDELNEELRRYRNKWDKLKEWAVKEFEMDNGLFKKYKKFNSNAKATSMYEDFVTCDEALLDKIRQIEMDGGENV